MGSSQDSSPNYRSLKGMMFEDALAELEGIVQQLEQGSSRLDESIVAYERGEALKAHCEQLINRAQGQVEKITRVAEQEKNNSSASHLDVNSSEAVRAEGGQSDTDKTRDYGGGDGAEDFVREELAVSNGDLVSSLARRG